MDCADRAWPRAGSEADAVAGVAICPYRHGIGVRGRRRAGDGVTPSAMGIPVAHRRDLHRPKCALHDLEFSWLAPWRSNAH